MENFADDCTITFSFMSLFSILCGIIGLSLLFPLGIFTTFFQEMLRQLHVSETYFILGLFWLVGLIFIVFYASIFLPFRQMRIGKFLIFISILFLFCSRLFFVDNFIVYFIWLVYFLLIAGLGIAILPFIPFFIIGSHSIKQMPRSLLTLDEINSDHDAIIVVDYINQLKFPIYGGGIDILINEFTDKYPFKVYQISNPEDFKKIVLNPHAKNLWIFGHGARDRLSFGAGIELKYNKLKDAPRKHFIAQLHCNNCIDTDCTSSLADLIADHGCVSKDYRKMIFYRRDTRLCLKAYNHLINSSSEKRILDIFNDLKMDRMKDGETINLIDKNRKLIATKNAINFQGDHLKKQIKYNPDFFQNHLSKSSDNTIRFILLHEEAHLTKGKNHLFMIFGVLVIIALASIFLMFSPISAQAILFGNTVAFSNFLLSVFFLLISLMIIVPASWRFLWDSMYDEEINSDRYGAESIVVFFNECDPANVAKDLLMADLTKSERDNLNLLTIILKILGTYPDCHPSAYVRVEKIRENFPTIDPPK